MLESLVLLKDLLGWKLEDLVLFSMHSRPESYPIDDLDEHVNVTIINYNEGKCKNNKCHPAQLRTFKELNIETLLN